MNPAIMSASSKRVRQNPLELLAMEAQGRNRVLVATVIESITADQEAAISNLDNRKRTHLEPMSAKVFCSTGCGNFFDLDELGLLTPPSKVC